MSSTRLLFVRHAQSATPDIFLGSELDPGLSPLGYEQARRLARDLAAARPAVVVCSGMLRARLTAAAVAETCGVPLIVDPDLRERALGRIGGLSHAEGKALWADVNRRWRAGDLDAAVPGGESFRQVAARVVPVLSRMVERFRGQTVVVVSHGGVIRIVLHVLVSDAPEMADNGLSIANGAVQELEFTGGGWKAVRLDIRPPGQTIDPLAEEDHTLR